MEGSNIQQPHENWQSWEHWQELKRIRQKEYTDEVEHLIKEWGDEVRSKQKEFLQGYERGFYLAPFSMAPSEFDGFLTKSRNNFHEAILQPITENILRRIRLAGEAHCQGQKSIQFEYSRAITPNAGPNNGHLSTAISTSPQKSGLNAGGAAGMASQAPKTQVSAPQPALNAESLPTPTSTISPTADEHARPTNPPVKFEDVFQNGQAQHRIVEAFRGEWYIVKCDEHKKYFTGERPLQGAAKHLDSLAHDFIQPRNQDRALRLLGHRVIGCDKDLAARNNSLLPYKKSSTESRASDIAKTPSGASAKLSLKTPGRGVALIAHGASESSEDSNVEPPSEWISDAGGLITKPKTFHIYWAFYRENLRDDPKLWPVLILGWDDLTPGGLQGDLVGTGLLDDPVPLRGYKVRSNAIVGWAKGFEDDGPRVTQRRFPVMFFDERQCVGWVAPRDLRKWYV
ncbi:hypothetical protein F5Y18DRAFT_249158 [Xylariaceae sp. FL1019]|nr:hypothetical protein F5Y18DRAFT_249158 [Xylariaceae sp. FL1019]